eukprot:7554262-Pyramimonas_sp.AAC.2
MSRQLCRVSRSAFAREPLDHSLGAAVGHFWSPVMKPNLMTQLEKKLGAPLGKALVHELRRCQRLRNELSHFATNLQTYMMFEVRDSNAPLQPLVYPSFHPPSCLQTYMMFEVRDSSAPLHPSRL